VIDYVDECFEPLYPVLAELPWGRRGWYANFMAQVYHFVCHSSRLLALVASRIELEDEELHRRFLAHAAEERGHHLLALHDLRAAGFELEQFPELPSTAGFYQSQYYKIEHQDPVAFFGYVLMLEGLGVKRGDEIYKGALDHHGVEGCTFLKVHVDADQDHFAKAVANVGRLPEARLAFVRRSLRDSVGLFRLILEETQRAVDPAPKRP
jgi:heme oxygenase-like protein